MSQIYNEIVVTTDEHILRTREGNYTLKNGEKYVARRKTAGNLVGALQVAEYTGENYELESNEADYVIKSVEEESDKEAGTVEEYIEQHTAKEVIKDIENKDLDYSLESLAEVDERKTVQKAVEQVLEEEEE